ncbi:MAG: flagellar protein FliT [Gammaproteobacteria bacterium]
MNNAANTHSANVIPMPQPGNGARGGRGPVIERLLQLSETMLQAANESAWDTVSQHDLERQRLAWELGGAPMGIDERGVWDDAIARIISISKSLTELAARDREAVASKLRSLHKRDQMSQAYAAF